MEQVDLVMEQIPQQSKLSIFFLIRNVFYTVKNRHYFFFITYCKTILPREDYKIEH